MSRQTRLSLLILNCAKPGPSASSVGLWKVCDVTPGANEGWSPCTAVTEGRMGIPTAGLGDVVEAFPPHL